MKNRRSIRLPNYDYASNGAYFVTICTQNKQYWFGDIIDGKMILNKYGIIVSESWKWLHDQYDYIKLDAHIIMPNHLHGIIIIYHQIGDLRCTGGSRYIGDLCFMGDSRIAPTKFKSLGRLIGAFKTVSTKRINEIYYDGQIKLWQRNYYEHIIRNEIELNNIRKYINDNPIKWEYDNHHQ